MRGDPTPTPDALPCGCGVSTDQLFAFVDITAGVEVSPADLDEAQAALVATDTLRAIRDHVACCHGCRCRIDRERRLREAMAEGCCTQAPPALVARVRQRLLVLSLREGGE